MFLSKANWIWSENRKQAIHLTRMREIHFLFIPTSKWHVASHAFFLKCRQKMLLLFFTSYEFNKRFNELALFFCWGISRYARRRPLTFEALIYMLKVQMVSGTRDTRCSGENFLVKGSISFPMFDLRTSETNTHTHTHHWINETSKWHG